MPGAPESQAEPFTDDGPNCCTISFEPGVTTIIVAVEIRGDTVAEPDEYIVIQFGNPTGAVMGGFWGLGFAVIINDDG